MELSFEQHNISCRKQVFRQTKMNQEYVDCIVPDRYEDIAKLAFTDTQLFLKGKNLTSHGASVSGSAEITIFYISEGLERLRCVSLVKDFTVDFDSDVIAPDSVLQASITSQGVQTHLVNSRKIGVQLSIGVELCAWVEDSFPISVTIDQNEENGLQLLWEKNGCLITTDVAEKTFVISEQIPLSPEVRVMQLVCSHADLVCYEHQLIGSKILLKGGAELRLGFETDDGKIPRFFEQCIPFSVLVDSPGEDVEIANVLLQPTALYTSLADAVNDAKVVETEIHAVAQIRFYERKEVNCLSDAFSTRFPLLTEEKTVLVSSSQRKETQNISAEEQSEIDGSEYTVIAKKGEILSYMIRDGKAVASAIISGVLQTENGSLSAAQKLLSFEIPLPSENGELSQIRLNTYEVRAEHGRIVFSAELQFDFDIFDYTELHIVSAAQLDTDNAFPLSELPSLSLVKQNGRSLWELAKRYHASLAAIEELSKKHELPPNILLIPRS